MSRYRSRQTLTFLRAAAIALAALAVLLGSPSDVAAECSFVPPWPNVTPAIPSARDIVVGDVVDDFDQSELETDDGLPRSEALRVIAVLRGDHEVGDLLDTEFLLPNWPWTKTSADRPALASCSYLQALPGERIAIAFDALKSGREITTPDNVTWYQPATRYNAMGVLIANGPAGWGKSRERVTLAQLHELAGLPATDGAMPPLDEPDSPPWLPLVAGLFAGATTLLWARRTRDLPKR